MQNTLTLINTGSLYNVSTDQILGYLKSKEYLTHLKIYFEEIVQAEDISRGEMLNLFSADREDQALSVSFKKV